MNSTFKKITLKAAALFCAVVISSFALAGCGGETSTKTSSSDNQKASVVVTEAPKSDIDISKLENKEAVIDVKDYGTITVKLEPEYAPETVENFINLCEEGFYDGLTFHRIISGFMIQGGDPTGTGMGGSDKEIKGEFASNGVENDLSHTRGTISMARSQDPDSASSQFFIVHDDSTYLDGQYAAFGSVTDGMDVVDAIATATYTSADSNGTLSDKTEQPVINSIKIQDIK